MGQNRSVLPCPFYARRFRLCGENRNRDFKVMAHSRIWQPYSPLFADFMEDGAEEIQHLREDVYERMAVDHIIGSPIATEPTSPDFDGYHSKVTFNKQNKDLMPIFGGADKVSSNAITLFSEQNSEISQCVDLSMINDYGSPIKIVEKGRIAGTRGATKHKFLSSPIFFGKYSGGDMPERKSGSYKYVDDLFINSFTVIYSRGMTGCIAPADGIYAVNAFLSPRASSYVTSRRVNSTWWDGSIRVYGFYGRSNGSLPSLDVIIDLQKNLDFSQPYNPSAGQYYHNWTQGEILQTSDIVDLTGISVSGTTLINDPGRIYRASSQAFAYSEDRRMGLPVLNWAGRLLSGESISVHVNMDVDLEQTAYMYCDIYITMVRLA